jgi:hypothetical protein
MSFLLIRFAKQIMKEKTWSVTLFCSQRNHCHEGIPAQTRSTLVAAAGCVVVFGVFVVQFLAQR